MMQHEQDLVSIRKYLEERGFVENDRLPPERELAGQLGLTRNRVRGGLRKLVAEGLIWRHVGQGTYFGPRLSPLINRRTLDALAETTYPREVMDVRVAFEPEVARLAALRATGRDFAQLDQCLERMRTTTDWTVWGVCDAQLHRLIAVAAGNTLMLAMFDTMHAGRKKLVWGRLGSSSIRDSRRLEILEEHAEIVRAIRDRDPDGAAAAMRKHVTTARRNMFGE
jgi:GntR family transcriptional repressor for pyruvate dehydrogenase complex